MKIQTSGDQMQIKTGGVTMLVLGVVFVLVGLFTTALPFLGMSSDDGQPVAKWASLFGLFLLGIGIFMVVTAKKRLITLVKNGESNITDTKIIGGGVKSQNFQTADVVAVNLATRSEYVGSSDSNNSSTAQRRSDLHLILKDNSVVEVDSSVLKGGFNLNGMDVSGLIRKAPLSREAEQIAVFLGVPVKYEDVSSLQGLRNAKMGNNQPENATPPINPDAPPSAQPQVTEVPTQAEKPPTDSGQIPPQGELK